VPVRVLDGDAQALRKRKSSHRLLELLKALTAMGGHEVPGAWLCNAVRPDADADADADGDAARRSLETSLSRLRKLLGSADALQFRSGKVSFDASRVWLDLGAFAHRLRALDAAAPRSPAWAEQAHRALAFCRRPLLAGEADWAWLAAERERWQQRWLATVTQLTTHHGQRGGRNALQRPLDAAHAVDGCESVAAALKA